MDPDHFEWSCSVCTLFNEPHVSICVVCGANKNQSSNLNSEVLNSQKSLIQSLKPKTPTPPPPPTIATTSTHKNASTDNCSIDQPQNMNTNKKDTDINDDDDDNKQMNDILDDNIDINETEMSIDGNHNIDETENEPENDGFDFEDDHDENDGFDEEDENDGFDDGDWGSDDDDLVYDEQKIVEHKEEESAEILRRALEKRRLAQSKLSSFWKCGKCSFLNHPSRAVCMMCSMPQLDVVHHIMSCPSSELKICIKCKAFVVPYLYDDHVLDCKPIGALDTEKANQAWFCKLTSCEQKAINHVNGLAMKKSADPKQKQKLIQIIKQIDNGRYVAVINDTLNAVHHFLEWVVPIIIRVHIADLIPKIMNDTHYRNLFEIGKGSGGNCLNTRRTEEGKMFGPVYDGAKAFERPKYGCLNIGLREAGCTQANMYGDGYFLMNDTTVRWRTTLTVQDSFSVNGECGTVKHCDHLLTQLQPQELQEIIEASLYAKKGGDKQNAYREIQIHGPVQLNRDIISVHVPSVHKKNQKLVNTLNLFCQKNMCKLVYFEPYTPQQHQMQHTGY